MACQEQRNCADCEAALGMYLHIHAKRFHWASSRYVRESREAAAPSGKLAVTELYGQSSLLRFLISEGLTQAES